MDKTYTKYILFTLIILLSTTLFAQKKDTKLKQIQKVNSDSTLIDSLTLKQSIIKNKKANISNTSLSTLKRNTSKDNINKSKKALLTDQINKRNEVKKDLITIHHSKNTLNKNLQQETNKLNRNVLSDHLNKEKSQLKKGLINEKNSGINNVENEKNKILNNRNELEKEANKFSKDGFDSAIKENETIRKLESNKVKIVEKNKEIKDIDPVKTAQQSQIGQKVYQNKDTQLNDMLGGKDESSEKANFRKENIIAEGTKDFTAKEEEMKSKVEKSKVKKLDAAFREKLYKRKPDFKEFIFKEKKSFFERFNLSANALMTNNQLNAINIAPLFEIEASPKLMFNIGPCFQHNLTKERNIKNTLSFKVSMQYHIIEKKIFLYAENQSLAPEFSYIGNEEKDTNWENAPLFGAGISLKEIVGIPLMGTILYNPISESNINNGKKGFNLNLGFQF